MTKAKRIAIIDDRTAFGQGEADEFEKAVKAHGGTIVTREYTDNHAVDFSTQITRIKATNADLVFFGGLDNQAAGFARRMKQLGLNAQLVGGGGVMDPDFIKLAGDAADGVMAWEYGRPLAQLPGGKDFSAKFKKRFGEDILSYAPFGYDGAWAAIKAMQQAKSSSPDGISAGAEGDRFRRRDREDFVRQHRRAEERRIHAVSGEERRVGADRDEERDLSRVRHPAGGRSGPARTCNRAATSRSPP